MMQQITEQLSSFWKNGKLTAPQLTYTFYETYIKIKRIFAQNSPRSLPNSSIAEIIELFTKLISLLPQTSQFSEERKLIYKHQYCAELLRLVDSLFNSSNVIFMHNQKNELAAIQIKLNRFINLPVKNEPAETEPAKSKALEKKEYVNKDLDMTDLFDAINEQTKATGIYPEGPNLSPSLHKKPELPLPASSSSSVANSEQTNTKSVFDWLMSLFRSQKHYTIIYEQLLDQRYLNQAQRNERILQCVQTGFFFAAKDGAEQVFKDFTRDVLLKHKSLLNLPKALVEGIKRGEKSNLIFQLKEHFKFDDIVNKIVYDKTNRSLVYYQIAKEAGFPINNIEENEQLHEAIEGYSQGPSYLLHEIIVTAFQGQEFDGIILRVNNNRKINLDIEHQKTVLGIEHLSLEVVDSNSGFTMGYIDGMCSAHFVPTSHNNEKGYRLDSLHTDSEFLYKIFHGQKVTKGELIRNLLPPERHQQKLIEQDTKNKSSHRA